MFSRGRVCPVHAVLAACSSLVLLMGCPQLLKDDFAVAARTEVTAGRGSSGSAGATEVDTSQGGDYSPGTAGSGTGNSSGLGGSGDGDTNGVGGSGGATISDTSSGGLSGASCEFGEFQDPVQVTGLGAYGNQWGSSLSRDSLTLYFSVWNNSTDRIYRATRPDRGTVFSRAEALAELRTAGVSNASPFLSYDGLTLYFRSSGALGGSDHDLWYSRRLSESVAFSGAQPVDFANSTSNDDRPWLSQDELTLLFVSDRLRAGDADIWIATRVALDIPFAEPVSLDQVNSEFRDEGPALSSDGLTLYFVSDRPNRVNERDIWQAVRLDRNGAFDAITRLDRLSSPQLETDLALSADGRELFFSSGRSGSSVIWRSIRDCK